MIPKRILHAVWVLFFAFIILSSASPADAARSYGRGPYGGGFSSAVSKLDDDKVKEIEIPILFGVMLSNLTKNFGDPRDGGARSHEGLDIMAPLGTPIVTPTEAVVLSFGNGAGSGNYVSTANPGGERFVYMHLDTIADIRSGDVLKVGDMIGTVGDTGNAKGGPSHLHFEIRDSKATDPFPRIEKEYTLKEKMEFLNSGFKDLDDEKDLAKFLVTRYKKEFQSAVNSGYDLPAVIDAELKKQGIVSNAGLQKQFDDVIASIPKVITKELRLDSQGAEVSLIQFYLIARSSGPAVTKLSASGATGFYGPATAAAMSEYQTAKKIPVTGIYDAKTREAMIK